MPKLLYSYPHHFPIFIFSSRCKTTEIAFSSLYILLRKEGSVGQNIYRFEQHSNRDSSKLCVELNELKKTTKRADFVLRDAGKHIYVISFHNISTWCNPINPYLISTGLRRTQQTLILILINYLMKVVLSSCITFSKTWCILYSLEYGQWTVTFTFVSTICWRYWRLFVRGIDRVLFLVSKQ